jgi:hypothetical protein
VPGGRQRCTRGCVWPKTGRPKWHDRPEDCPAFKATSPAPVVQEPAKIPTPAPTEAEPAPAPKKPGLLARLSFGGSKTKPEMPLQPAVTKTEPEFHVDAGHAMVVANIVYGSMRWGWNRWDDWAETEAAGMKRFVDKHPELLKLSDLEKESLRLDPDTDMWGRFATWGARMAGAKTREQAHALIDTGNLVARFGSMFAFGGEHAIKSFKAGAPIRAAKKAAEEARRKAEREVRDRDRKSAPGNEGGSASLPRPAPIEHP